LLEIPECKTIDEKGQNKSNICKRSVSSSKWLVYQSAVGPHTWNENKGHKAVGFVVATHPWEWVRWGDEIFEKTSDRRLILTISKVNISGFWATLSETLLQSFLLLQQYLAHWLKVQEKRDNRRKKVITFIMWWKFFFFLQLLVVVVCSVCVTILKIILIVDIISKVNCSWHFLGTCMDCIHNVMQMIPSQIQ